jgi:hypothetical protein
LGGEGEMEGERKRSFESEGEGFDSENSLLMIQYSIILIGVAS